MRTRIGAALRRCPWSVVLLWPLELHAGVVNPDISVIGQPVVTYSDDASRPDHDRLQMDVGETELVFDAALNPYARGTFIASLASEGIELEEGFFVLNRGLPAGLALKGGKYRCDFGRLNPAHPHTYPFAERFHVLAEYLPGEESLNETGLSLSRRFAVAGDVSINASADWLAGSTFRGTDDSDAGFAEDPKRDEPRPAALGRLSAFSMLGDRSALDLGVSAVSGTNNVAAGARTTVVGVDAKAKLWRSPQAYFVLQAEGLHLSRDVATPRSDGYDIDTRSATGGYLFADYNFGLRYNVGASFERFEFADEGAGDAKAVGLFAGYSLMEETTVLRADWNRLTPDEGPAVQTITLRILYSMGPHKAHQF